MQSILITGGTGSFGRAFVRYLLDETQASRIVIYSRGEHAQEEMERELNNERLRFFIGDVRDRSRLEMAMRGVDTVVHAAALKVVPIAEYNPTECAETNVGGAANVVQASIRAGVERVVALSTDKAVNPINLYGASKLAAEKIFIAAGALSAGQTRFNVVRYGNVHGSRGSVVPLFKKIAAEGKPLPITDIRMTRFWITMDEAIQLVMKPIGWPGLQSCIFVPLIPSIKITDLAEAIAPGAERLLTGIRPGEKIDETLITTDEARYTSEFGGVYIIQPREKSPTCLVADDFSYTSGNNKRFLTVKEIRSLL